MEHGAITVSSVWASPTRSEPRWPLGLLLGLLLAFAGSGTAQTAEDLLRQGEYAAAYEQASAVQSAAMQLTAARAATDQVVYAMAPAGAVLADELVWLKRAVAAGENAVKLDPGSAPALVQLVRAKGEIARRSGVLQNLNVASELKNLFDRALKLDPSDADALVGLAMWNLELVEAGVGWLYGAKRSEVLPLLEKGVAAAPQQINLRVEYATALRALGMPDEAREQLEIALKLPTTSASDIAEQGRAEAMLGELP